MKVRFEVGSGYPIYYESEDGDEIELTDEELARWRLMDDEWNKMQALIGDRLTREM